MCGNSICQDRRFLAKDMPALEEFFHYRNLDVSTLKELAKRWKPSALEGIKKAQSHRAGRHPRVDRRTAAPPLDPARPLSAGDDVSRDRAGVVCGKLL